MKKICVVTATRAEYGLLRNSILEIIRDDELELCLIVTGTHLSPEFGMTVNEIDTDNIPIVQKIDILMSGDSPAAVGKTMGMANIAFSDMFQKEKPDFLLVLGDRYELIPICSSAMVFQIPIGHISGGEVTSGAMDDAIRHCISKLSYLHFPGCETYRQRIIQLGESPDRVFNFGDVGVETVKKMEFISKQELSEIVDLDLSTPYMCITFHPATLENSSSITQIKELFKAIDKFSQYNFLFTKANADLSGKIINQHIDDYVLNNKNCRAFTSLGIRNYLSSVKYSCGVIGNSSSGIVEAPALGVATVNIGNRQEGRLQADSIINCKPIATDIEQSIRLALTQEFKSKARQTTNPYGAGDTSVLMIKKIKEYLINDKINIKKEFYDIRR